MPCRHPHPARLPRRWLMTDERLGDSLWSAVNSMPRGSGIIFRHYATPQPARLQLFKQVRRAAQRKGLMLVVAGRPLGRGLVHRHGRARGTLTAPIHSRVEAIAASRAGAVLLFVSPVHPTRSHPGAATLGRVRLGLMIRDLKLPVIALGGMNEQRWRALRSLGVHGWAGIDAWA